MRKLIFFIPLLSLFGCTHRVFVVAPKVKRSTIVQHGLNDRVLSGESSIFSNTVSFEQLKRLDGNSDHGSFHIFMVSDSVYIEAKSRVLNRDSIVLGGMVLSNQKQDTLYFSLSYSTRVNPVKLLRLANDVYSLELRFPSEPFIQTLQKSNDRDLVESYTLFNVKNTIIQDNMLELLTGEAQKVHGRRFKYIITNDPAKQDYYLTSIGLLDAAFLSVSEQENYINRCREEKKIKCKTYSIDLKYNYWNYKVKCICKD